MTKPDQPSRLPVRSVALTVAGFLCMGIGLLVGLETVAGMVRMHYGAGVSSDGSSFISFAYAKDSMLFLKYSAALVLAGALFAVAGYVIRIIRKRRD